MSGGGCGWPSRQSPGKFYPDVLRSSVYYFTVAGSARRVLSTWPGHSMNPMQGWRCGRQAGMTVDFPDHVGRQNEDEARFRYRKLGFPQSGTTAAHACPIRRSRGYFDRRVDDLPEAQLRKAGTRRNTSAPRPAPAAPGQKLPENGVSTAAMPGLAMIRARSGRRRRGRENCAAHRVGEFGKQIAGKRSTA